MYIFLLLESFLYPSSCFLFLNYHKISTVGNRVTKTAEENIFATWKAVDVSQQNCVFGWKVKTMDSTGECGVGGGVGGVSLQWNDKY